MRAETGSCRCPALPVVQSSLAAALLWCGTPVVLIRLLCVCVQVQPLAIQTNDPAGFTLVDVLAWGSIGHAIA